LTPHDQRADVGIARGDDASNGATPSERFQLAQARHVGRGASAVAFFAAGGGPLFHPRPVRYDSSLEQFLPAGVVVFDRASLARPWRDPRSPGRVLLDFRRVDFGQQLAFFTTLPSL